MIVHVYIAMPNKYLAVEDDHSTGEYCVGRGCYPNSAGVVQLDAAIMRGKDLQFGAVAGLERSKINEYEL